MYIANQLKKVCIKKKQDIGNKKAGITRKNLVLGLQN